MADALSGPSATVVTLGSRVSSATTGRSGCLRYMSSVR